jgi:hypothetical protein
MRVMGPTILVVALTVTAGCGGGGSSDTAAHSSAAPTAAATSTTGAPSPSATALAPSSGAKADIAAITKLAKAIDSGKAATVCRTLMTPAMISATFGSVDNCIADDEDDPTNGATVASVQVSGSTATAVVTDKGGSSDGATGTWHFERTGKTWRLAEWGVDYLRSQLDVNFGPRYRSSGADDPFHDAAYRLCFHDGMLAKDDATFRKIALGMETNHNTLTGQVFAPCASKAPDGISPFRKTFETGVRDQLHAFGAPTEAADCVVDKLRTALDEAVLINALLDGPGSKQLTKVSGTVNNAARACAKGSTGLQPTIRAPKHRYAIRPVH